jgi:hypothetical protein
LGEESKHFFFEKKKQKTFIHLAAVPMDKSFFASFFSKKEVLAYTKDAAVTLVTPASMIQVPSVRRSIVPALSVTVLAAASAP